MIMIRCLRVLHTQSDRDVTVCRRLAKGVIDMARMEAQLRRSGLDWTVVRPPRLTNGQKTGAYRTAIHQHLTKAQGITRADLADYMIKSIPDEATYRAVVEISN
nr:NAD(P)H-binding protein [Cohnella sp. REN36]